MIRSAVTVSLVPEARGGPFVYWDDLPAACTKAKKLGFDAVEIFPPGPGALEPGALHRLLDGEGLTLAAVGTGAGWVKHRLTLCLPDASARAKAKGFIKSIVDFAAAFKAPAIIGSMQGRHGEGVDAAIARAQLAEALEELGDYAGHHGVPLLYEPLNRYETNQVNTLADGVGLLKSLSTKNVRLLADLVHMNIEESEVADALRAAGPFVGHLHFVDSNRRAAGQGHLDFAPIAKALIESGYDGYASAEALPLPDPDAAAQKTIDAFKKWFRA